MALFKSNKKYRSDMEIFASNSVNDYIPLQRNNQYSQKEIQGKIIFCVTGAKTAMTSFQGLMENINCFHDY